MPKAWRQLEGHAERSERGGNSPAGGGADALVRIVGFADLKQPNACGRFIQRFGGRRPDLPNRSHRVNEFLACRHATALRTIDESPRGEIPAIVKVIFRVHVQIAHGMGRMDLPFAAETLQDVTELLRAARLERISLEEPKLGPE